MHFRQARRRELSDVIPLDQLVERGFEVLAKPRTEAVKIIAKIS